MTQKATKQILLISIGLLLAVNTFESCMIFMPHRVPVIIIDPVCEMKVDKTEAYTCKYKDKKYYFDTYTCKETFKMNPEKFLEKKCDGL